LQEDSQLALLDALADQRFGALAVEARLAAVFLGRLDAGFPDDDLAPAVLAIRDESLERGVV
jgi:hypothetical protein